MKRMFLVIAAVLLSAAAVSAQDYVPTSSWPYLYEDFTDGTVYMQGGEKLSLKMNVQLRADNIHFLEKDIIKQAVTKDVVAVFIGEDKFILVDGRAMKVVKDAENGCIVKETLGDFAALNETGGAYGTSSTTSSTRKVSSLELDSQINQNHMLLLNQKHEGTQLPLIENFYIVTPKVVCKASKSEVEASLGDAQKSGWKTFLKENKIKWRDPESLVRIVEFINSAE